MKPAMSKLPKITISVSKGKEDDHLTVAEVTTNDSNMIRKDSSFTILPDDVSRNGLSRMMLN
jgi:hypothetical protein